MLCLPRLRCLSLLHNKRISTDHLKQIQAQLVTSGFNCPSLSAKLIEKYCALSSPLGIIHAHLVLQHHDQPNLFLLNTFIRCAPPEKSMAVFAKWVSASKLVFDKHTYIFVLGACARSPSLQALWLGKQTHAQMLKLGAMSSIWLQTAAIHFYSSNGEVDLARRVFDEMAVRNSITWNAMITGYCSHRERAENAAPEALMLFRDMLLEEVSGVKPTDTTVVCILSAASQLGALETGACIHGHVEKTIGVPEDDVFIGTGLVDMYSKCGCLDSASAVFRSMKHRNVLTWTAMATGLAVHGKGKEALEVLSAMEASGVKPNQVTFTSLLSACCHAGLVEEGLELFHQMESKFSVTPQMQHHGCIVNLLARAGRLQEAHDFIMAMLNHVDLISWRSLLSACKIHGDVAMAEKVGKHLLQLQQEQSLGSSTGRSSEDYVALSNVYASAERWGDVVSVRDEMKVKGIDNKAGYSSVQTLGSQLSDVLYIEKKEGMPVEKN